MGFKFTEEALNTVLAELAKDYALYAPKRFIGGDTFSEVDCIRYGEISRVDEIVTDEISDYSFKEWLLPVSQTLFYFTEENIREPFFPEKDAIIFLRSCDLHAIQRLDEIYLYNGYTDHFYQKVRDRVKFILIGCPNAFDDCFCVDMGTNYTEKYEASFEPIGDLYYMDCKLDEWEGLFSQHGQVVEGFKPSYVTTTPVRVNLPSDLSPAVARASMWKEYDTRCIDCGRCNYVCPTCTCFTMQDVFYQDNGKAGERRRVHSSCMVRGFTDVAGGGSYRNKNGERMRFKVMHKVYDFNERFGYQMCVGCGRCDSCCPEYISFHHILNRLDEAMEEVRGDGK